MWQSLSPASHAVNLTCMDRWLPGCLNAAKSLDKCTFQPSTSPKEDGVWCINAHFLPAENVIDCLSAGPASGEEGWGAAASSAGCSLGAAGSWGADCAEAGADKPNGPLAGQLPVASALMLMGLALLSFDFWPLPASSATHEQI